MPPAAERPPRFSRSPPAPGWRPRSALPPRSPSSVSSAGHPATPAFGASQPHRQTLDPLHRNTPPHPDRPVCPGGPGTPPELDLAQLAGAHLLGHQGQLSLEVIGGQGRNIQPHPLHQGTSEENHSHDGKD